MKQEKWSSALEQAPDVDKMVQEFEKILDTYMSQCFSWKHVRRKSNDSPWLTRLSKNSN